MSTGATGNLSEVEATDYAYPLIKTYRQLETVPAGDVGTVGKKLSFVAKSITRYVACALIGKIRADRLVSDEIQGELSKLVRPSDGMFPQLTRRILKVYQHANDPFVNSVREFFADTVPPAVFDHMWQLAGLISQPLPSNANQYERALDLLVQYRNADAHERLDEAGRANATVHLREILEAVLARLSFLAALPLLEVIGVRREIDGEFHDCRIWNGLLPRREERSFPVELVSGHTYLLLHDTDNSTETQILDLSPFCMGLDAEQHNGADVYFLNGRKKSRVDFYSYASESALLLSPEHALYAPVAAMVDEVGTEASQEAGLPEYMRHYFEVSGESERAFNKAQVELKDGEIDSAVEQLEFAIGKSPGYREAIEQLVELYDEMQLFGEAHEVLEQYLDLVPHDIDFLLLDADALAHMGEKERARGRVRGVRALDPQNERARELEAAIDRADEEEPDEDGEDEERHVTLLPREVLVSGRPFSPMARLVTALVTFSSTMLTAGLFYMETDTIMALTILATGVYWAATNWANRRIRKLLAESRHNFAAFLKARKGLRHSQVFDDMLIHIFGTIAEEPKPLARIVGTLRLNRKRVIRLVAVSVLATVWINSIAVTPVDSVLPRALFFLHSLLLFLAFFYHVSCLIRYQQQLRQLEAQEIHFSLVQHPKLSIRYLSQLSRKISAPMLLVYLLASVAMYLGPFLANLAFVFAITVLLIISIFVYYSAIFLVRGVIIKNKWRLISRFSVHFDAPFERLVSEARQRDMDRIQELIAMRDFLDSMDVWAEKKGNLLMTSLLYLGTILFATIGLSNLMTRQIMPEVSQAANSIRSYEDTHVVGPVEPGAAYDVRVSQTDDVFFVAWGHSQDQLSAAVDDYLSGSEMARTRKNVGRHGDSRGFERCDWSNGVHGSIDLSIPPFEELHLLLYGHNKIYEGFLLMGGGKYSHTLSVSRSGREIYSSSRFVRMNTNETGYVSHLVLRADGSQITSRVRQGDEVMNDPRNDAMVQKLRHQFSAVEGPESVKLDGF